MKLLYLYSTIDPSCYFAILVDPLKNFLYFLETLEGTYL